MCEAFKNTVKGEITQLLEPILQVTCIHICIYTLILISSRGWTIFQLKTQQRDKNYQHFNSKLGF
jgi:hypothetical protein